MNPLTEIGAFRCPCGYVAKSANGLGVHSRRCPACTDEHRFWLRVDKSAGPEACWPYTGSITTHGYGCTYYQGRVLGAHKVAYLFAKGDVPEGHEIMHACDNPPCCNPLHLSVGTRQANVDDKIAKGRSGVRPWSEQRKLTPQDVLEIRSLRGIERSGSLAKRFNVEQPHIINIWNRKVWRHI